MTSNIGQTGMKSLRLKGMKIEELPLPMGARVKDQIELARDTERQNEIGEIIATHPTQRCDYLEGRIAEAKKSQENMNNLALVEQQRIQEYQGHIEMCKHRDREVEKLEANKELPEDYVAEKIKELKLRFPYNTERLQAQIDISNGSIQRFQEVTRRESGSIQELSEALALCKERDRLLKHHGVQVATG